MTDDKRTKNEIIKESSRLLRGTIAEGLADVVTGAISEDDSQLTKFHGTYLQDDRDVRPERAKKKLEKAYSFMIRVRLPGGVTTSKQWLSLDAIAGTYANHTLRLTTRQTFQFHGVIKSNMKRTMQAINAALLDTLAACGDVNRNVLAAGNPFLSKVHAAAHKLAVDVSQHLLPQTGAYHEIWLDGEQVMDQSGPAKKEEEPIYGTHYLPRKFKIVIAVPPSNDVDIFAHDLGYIAIVENGKLVGWNVTIGGGMGMTHGEPDTFPRTADMLGFCTPEQAVDVAEKVVTVQRDWGNRTSRKRARLKYTIEDRGLDAFRDEVEKPPRLQAGRAAPVRVHVDRRCHRLGAGRRQEVAPDAVHRERPHQGYARLDACARRCARSPRCIPAASSSRPIRTSSSPTCRAKAKAKIEAILKEHGIAIGTALSGMRRSSMACVALPTCGLALAESERFLPELLTALEESLDKAGLKDDDIVIRMTGCPNGCARPYLAEIGLVGRNPGLYNLYLGAAFNGSRLNKLYAEDVDKARIVGLLEPMFARYAKEREEGEHFGDFVIRAGYVQATTAGNRFHADLDLVKTVS